MLLATELSDREFCDALGERNMSEVSDFRRYLKTAYYLSSSLFEAISL